MLPVRGTKMCDTASMLQNELPKVLSENGCDTSFAKDGSSSLTELVTVFVATMEDAKDFIDRLEASFCHELWPTLCSQLASFTSSKIELQKSVDEKKAENVILLTENFALRTELEQGNIRFDKAVQEAVENEMADKLQEVVHEKHELQESLKQCHGETQDLKCRLQSLEGENQELHQSRRRLQEVNEVLQQKLNRFERENEELQLRRRRDEEEYNSLQDSIQRIEKENLRLSSLVEDREEESSILKTRILLLDNENQRLNEARGTTEKSQMLRSKRLYLKRDQAPKNSRPFPFLTGKGPEQGLANCESPHFPNIIDPWHSPNLQHETKDDRSNLGLSKDSTLLVCDQEREAEVAPVPPQINNNADNKADQSTDARIVDNSATNTSGLAGVAKPLNTTESNDICNQLEKDPGDFEAPIVLLNIVDSDETVIDITLPDHVGHEASEEPPVIPIANANQAAAHDESLQLISRQHVSNEAAVRDAADGHLNQTHGCPVSTVPRLIPPELIPETHNVKESFKACLWRHPRSREQSRMGDPHDSFLDTPLEQVRAQLATNKHEAVENVHWPTSKQICHASVRPLEFEDGVNLEVDERAKSASGQKHFTAPHSKLDASNVICPSTKEKNTLPAKNPAGYKFNEPVRRKRDRENLAATDCGQCKKFYNALEAEDASGAMPPRCEHHDAVSRHRFQNIPPPTPEGFWNIGFSDSR